MYKRVSQFLSIPKDWSFLATGVVKRDCQLKPVLPAQRNEVSRFLDGQRHLLLEEHMLSSLKSKLSLGVVKKIGRTYVHSFYPR